MRNPITEKDIDKFINGRDEMRGIVNLEYQYRNNFIDVYYWDTDGQKKISREL